MAVFHKASHLQPPGSLLLDATLAVKVQIEQASPFRRLTLNQVHHDQRNSTRKLSGRKLSTNLHGSSPRHKQLSRTHISTSEEDWGRPLRLCLGKSRSLTHRCGQWCYRSPQAGGRRHPKIPVQRPCSPRTIARLPPASTPRYRTRVPHQLPHRPNLDLI